MLKLVRLTSYSTLQVPTLIYLALHLTKQYSSFDEPCAGHLSNGDTFLRLVLSGEEARQRGPFEAAGRYRKPQLQNQAETELKIEHMGKLLY